MTKNDLQNGDIVETRDGKRYVVLDGYIVSNDLCNLDLCFYDNGLFDKDLEAEFDIMKVCKQPMYPFKYLDRHIYPELRWDWIREKVKEVTMKEIEEKFGCRVKIVREKE